MREEEKIFAGILFCPGDPELKAVKLKTHNLNLRYNALPEDDVDGRSAVLDEILGSRGEGCFMQGPVYFHYGKHTKIGDRFFANFNFTVQDDAEVTIGNDCNFGPGVTIVTPLHPMIASERRLMLDGEGNKKRFCWAKPVRIGNDCWLGANVTVCPGVTVGDGCVIGAGSVVTKDIPANSFAAGVPCRVIRQITDADSMKYKTDIIGDNSVI